MQNITAPLHEHFIPSKWFHTTKAKVFYSVALMHHQNNMVESPLFIPAVVASYFWYFQLGWKGQLEPCCLFPYWSGRHILPWCKLLLQSNLPPWCMNCSRWSFLWLMLNCSIFMPRGKVHNLNRNWFVGSSSRSCGTWNMKFSVGCWHCKKLERNGEVAYLLEKGVVVETEVLVATPKEEDFLFLFLCTTFSTASLGGNTIPVATTMLVFVLALAAFFFASSLADPCRWNFSYVRLFNAVHIIYE